jgi:ribosomal protein S18 acetylase RimI-like enzyme
MGISDIVIRPAADGDKKSILALGPRLAIGVAPWRNQQEALAVGRSWLEDSIAAAAEGDGTVLVAVDNSKRRARPGDVVGVISIRPSRHFTGERDGYIGELAVAEHAARRGIGRALVAGADAWARDRGLENLTLHTGIFNTEARAFYASLGFAEEEVRLTRAISVTRAPGEGTVRSG